MKVNKKYESLCQGLSWKVPRYSAKIIFWNIPLASFGEDEFAIK